MDPVCWPLVGAVGRRLTVGWGGLASVGPLALGPARPPSPSVPQVWAMNNKYEFNPLHTSPEGYLLNWNLYQLQVYCRPYRSAPSSPP